MVQLDKPNLALEGPFDSSMEDCIQDQAKSPWVDGYALWTNQYTKYIHAAHELGSYIIYK